MYKSNLFILLSLLFLAMPSFAKILPGLIDRHGNPVHTADEFSLSVITTVSPDPQGYRYTYNLSLDINSVQPVWLFTVFLPDTTAFVPSSSYSPWGSAAPKIGGSKEATSARWGVVPEKNNPNLLIPSTAPQPFSFASPYPPGIAEAYAEGVTTGPWVPAGKASGNPLGFNNHTPYGPGKVFPVIGPVKPTTPNVTDNYSVIGCAGGICDVQLDITGPQDPYGNVYSYQWTGAFGSAVGAKPIVQLAAGTYNISVAVSDPYATLVTATMPITVIDPNPPVIVNPPATGTALTPAQVAALTPVELAALTPTQVSSIITLLSPAQIALLAPNQLIALSPAQVQSVSTLLTPAQLSAASGMIDEDSLSDNSDGDSSDSNSDNESDEDDKSS